MIFFFFKKEYYLKQTHHILTRVNKRSSKARVTRYYKH
jgi:hypothetical protein